jgi:type II secretory pathway pseudopilin PulG
MVDTGLTVVVVLVVLAAIAGAALLVVQGRRYRQEQQRIEDALLSEPDDLQLGADRPGGGWHGPSCSGGFPAVDPTQSEPEVPAQRTGDHDRDRREPVRALAGRLLRRRGSSEPG